MGGLWGVQNVRQRLKIKFDKFVFLTSVDGDVVISSENENGEVCVAKFQTGFDRNFVDQLVPLERHLRQMCDAISWPVYFVLS